MLDPVDADWARRTTELKNNLFISTTPLQGQNHLLLKQPLTPARLKQNIDELIETWQEKANKQAVEQFDCDILLVEDNESNNRIIRTLLTNLGARVDYCFNAEDARQLLAQKSYHVIFSDIHLPGASGIELLDYVNEADNVQSQGQFIVISAYVKESGKESLLEKGAFDVLEKPILYEELADTVRAALHDDNDIN